MSMTSTPPRVKKSPSIVKGILARFTQVAILLVVQAAILFLCVGRLTWNWAWLFLAITLVNILINSIFMMRISPETIAERGQAGESKDWDKVLSGLWSLVHFLLILLVAGLDLRFGWSPVLRIRWHLAGVVVFALGSGFFSWAMITNTFFSTVVRIQSDRGQTVCRSGPYRIVRHPGYSGAILQSLGIPLLLGSPWALLPGGVAAILMIVRTYLEDRTLQAELPGYQDFAKEVRYRLIPGIW